MTRRERRALQDRVGELGVLCLRLYEAVGSLNAAVRAARQAGAGDLAESLELTRGDLREHRMYYDKKREEVWLRLHPRPVVTQEAAALEDF